MKFKMLVVCFLVGFGLLAVPKTYTYAAEETIVAQEDVTENQNTIIDTTLLSTENETQITDQLEAEAIETESSEAVSSEAEPSEPIVAETNDVNLETTEDDEIIEEVIEEDESEDEKTEEKVTEKKKVKYSKAELRLLSALIYCEASGESYKGKLAVGIVVMNRKKSGQFPDSVKGVIYQKSQFGPVRNGSLDKALAEYDRGDFTSSAEKDCIKAAKAALNGSKSITVNGNKKDFGKYLYFSGNLRNAAYTLGNHEFK